MSMDRLHDGRRGTSAHRRSDHPEYIIEGGVRHDLPGSFARTEFAFSDG